MSDHVVDQAPLPLPADDELPALIEALLLAASGPTTVDELARAAGVAVEAVDAAVRTLARGEADGRGWIVVRHDDGVQLATAPRFAGYVRRFLRLERQTRLSAPALETLAIVAYRQPVTRGEVEAVRGVDCSGVLANLHARGLIETLGRLPTLGNPIQYGTTPAFLRHFGLRSLDDLPPLGEVDGQETATLLTQAVANADRDQAHSPSG